MRRPSRTNRADGPRNHLIRSRFVRLVRLAALYTEETLGLAIRHGVPKNLQGSARTNPDALSSARFSIFPLNFMGVTTTLGYRSMKAIMLTFNRSLERAWRDRENADPARFVPVSSLPDQREQGDLLSILHDPYFRSLIQQRGRALGFLSLESWVCTFKSSSGGTVYSPHEAAADANPHFLLFLDELRRRCVVDLEGQIRVACVRQEIPREGVCLVFPDNLSVCYFVEYSMRADQVHVQFSDYFESPRALLGLDDAAALPKARSKNLAKGFIQSGHKTIVHGGVLTHVDRRLHPRVFGPTIDTLLLASVLADYIRREKPLSIMEIGVGSGHIYTTAAVYSSTSLTLCGIDLEPSAILCTDTNLRRDREVFHLRNVQSKLIIDEFDPEFFATKFDLVVSNPPYISSHATPGTSGRQVHEMATSGTELIERILSSLPMLLTHNGRALLLLSSTTFKAEQWTPPGYEMENCLPGGTVTVPFDVEIVLDDQGWLDRLLELGGLTEVKEGYAHELRPVWIMRR
jgi:methylase of polypeptide subunit release factors